MTREEAIEFLENHEYWADFSWMDEVAEIAISDLEKQIPKKPIQELKASENDYYDCPSCRKYLFSEYKQKHCHHCGQALDWREEE